MKISFVISLGIILVLASCSGEHVQTISQLEPTHVKQMEPKIEPAIKCIPDWDCTEWSECVGTQTRRCFDKNNCGIEPPALSRSCTPNCGACQFLEDNKCKDYTCCSDADCDDGNDNNLDKCENPATRVSACNHSEIYNSLELELVKNHEDSSIRVIFNLAELEDFGLYHTLGFHVAKENGRDYWPKGEGLSEGNFVRALRKKTYETTVSNLNPDSEYEVCLIGMFKDFTSTGYFNCKTIRTEKKKKEHGLVLVNYDVDAEARRLVEEWISQIKGISIKLEDLKTGTTSDQLYRFLSDIYAESNLKYVVFVGWNVPLPYYQGQKMAYPLLSLSYDTANEDNGFENPDNPLNEVSIAAMRAENDEQLKEFLARLIEHYQSREKFGNKILVADAMTAEESGVKDFAATYYLGGITDYHDSDEAAEWIAEYGRLLSDDFDILVINAHGSVDFHYPCVEGKCIDADFIREHPTAIPFIIGIACNMGRFMVEGSPMASYVFEESLAGVGSEVYSVDISGNTVKHIVNGLNEGKTIGEASRPFGMVVFGDPFLRLR